MAGGQVGPAGAQREPAEEALAMSSHAWSDPTGPARGSAASGPPGGQGAPAGAAGTLHRAAALAACRRPMTPALATP